MASSGLIDVQMKNDGMKDFFGNNSETSEDTTLSAKSLSMKGKEVGFNPNVLFCCFLILASGLGFSMLKSGLSQAKNVVYSFKIHFIQISMGILVFWSVGFGFSMGQGNAFLGLTDFLVPATKVDEKCLLMLSVCLLMTSIVSGGGLERTTFVCDFLICLFVPLFLFPFPVHWCFSEDAWLAQKGYIDFAGAGPFHIVSGVSAGILAIVSKRRHFEFQVDSNISNKDLKRSGNNFHLTITGSFLTLMGFLAIPVAFCETQRESTNVFMNCLLSLAPGGLIAFLFSKLCTKKWSVYRISNGMVAGLIANSSALDIMYGWQCLITSALGGAFYILSRNLLLKLSIEDPLDIVSIHVAPAFLGLIVCPIINPQGLMYLGTAQSGWQIAWTISGSLILIIWSSLTSLIFFGILAIFGKLTQSEEKQLLGNDVSHIKEKSYMFLREFENMKPNNSDNNYQFAMSSPNLGRVEIAKHSFVASTQKDLILPRLVLENPNESFAQPIPPGVSNLPSFQESFSNQSKPDVTLLTPSSRTDLKKKLDSNNHDSGKLLPRKPWTLQKQKSISDEDDNNNSRDKYTQRESEIV